MEGEGGELLSSREQRRELGDKVDGNVGEEREHTFITVLHHQANARTFR